MIMNLNPRPVELRVRNTSVEVYFEQKSSCYFWSRDAKEQSIEVWNTTSHKKFSFWWMSFNLSPPLLIAPFIELALQV